MTVVEELVTVLGLEIGPGALTALSKFQAAVKNGLAGVGGIVVAAAAAFAGVTVSVAELGVETSRTAIKLGITTDAVQELRYAADISNVSFEALTTGMKFLSKNVAEAAMGSTTLSAQLAGIPLHDTNGRLKTADELLVALSAEFVKIKDPIKQTDVAVRLLGRSGTELIPFLKQGPEGIAKLRQAAHDMGVVLDEKTIEASKRFNFALKELKWSLFGLRNDMGAPFIDDFTHGIEWATKKLADFRKHTQDIVAWIRELGQRFGRIIEAGRMFADVLGRISAALKLDGIIKAVDWANLLQAAFIGVAAVGVTSAAVTAASWIVAAAPFLLLALLIGLIVDDIAHFVTGSKSMLGEADKWAKRFDPTDSPEVRFFRTLLALLFDLGDSKKWERVYEAAKHAFGPLMDDLNGFMKGPIGKLLVGDVGGATSQALDPLKNAIQKKWDDSHTVDPRMLAINDAKRELGSAYQSGDQARIKAAEGQYQIANMQGRRTAWDATPQEAERMDWQGYALNSQRAQDRFNANGTVTQRRQAKEDAAAANTSDAMDALEMQSLERRNSKTVNIQQKVEVNITTVAPPHVIEHHVKKALQEASDQAHSDAKAALAPGAS